MQTLLDKTLLFSRVSRVCRLGFPGQGTILHEPLWRPLPSPTLSPNLSLLVPLYRFQLLISPETDCASSCAGFVPIPAGGTHSSSSSRAPLPLLACCHASSFFASILGLPFLVDLATCCSFPQVLTASGRAESRGRARRAKLAKAYAAEPTKVALMILQCLQSPTSLTSPSQ